MIELLTANTPNGKKISIMLEEINHEYKITKVNNKFKSEKFVLFLIRSRNSSKDFLISYLLGLFI